MKNDLSFILAGLIVVTLTILGWAAVAAIFGFVFKLMGFY